MSDSSTKQLDVVLIITVACLVLIGIGMVASASMPIAMEHFKDPYIFLIRHITNVSISIGLLAVCYFLPTNWWQERASLILLITMILSFMVLIIGVKLNGSRRWFSILGNSIQVSEIAKLAVVIYASDFLSRKFSQMHLVFTAIPMVAVIGILTALLLFEPDFGSAFVIIFVMLSLIFVAQGSLTTLLAFVLTGLVGAIGFVIYSPYRYARLIGYLDPWSHRFDEGYQLTQSIIAYTRGGLWGRGYGSSMAKLFYLPESHTDFLFAILAEEWGVIGVLFVLFLFSLIIIRCMMASYRRFKVNDFFEAFIIFGWSQWVFIQVIINIGATIGLLPTKGLTLPFFSYGGTSMVVHAMILGIILKIMRNPVRAM